MSLKNSIVNNIQNHEEAVAGDRAESVISKHPKFLLQIVLKLPLVSHNLLPAQTFKHQENTSQKHIIKASYIWTAYLEVITSPLEKTRMWCPKCSWKFFMRTLSSVLHLKLIFISITWNMIFHKVLKGYSYNDYYM